MRFIMKLRPVHHHFHRFQRVGWLSGIKQGHKLSVLDRADIFPTDLRDTGLKYTDMKFT